MDSDSDFLCNENVCKIGNSYVLNQTLIAMTDDVTDSFKDTVSNIVTDFDVSNTSVLFCGQNLTMEEEEYIEKSR